MKEIKKEIKNRIEKYYTLVKKEMIDNGDQTRQYGWYLGKIDALEDLLDYINGTEL